MMDNLTSNHTFTSIFQNHPDADSREIGASEASRHRGPDFPSTLYSPEGLSAATFYNECSSAVLVAKLLYYTAGQRAGET